MLRLRARLVVVCLYMLFVSACDRSSRSQAPTTARGLRPDPCSHTAVSSGTAVFQWLLPSEAENPSPARVISTTDLAIADDASLYIVDQFESAVFHIDTAGRVLHEWGESGDGPGEFRTPQTVAVGFNGRIYVGDAAGRISTFSPNGVLVATARARSFGGINDMVILPNGNIVIAADARPLEARSDAYVSIVDSLGDKVRDVLRISERGASGARPLMGHQINPVRLTRGQGGTFAAWYPMDNYAEVFDSTGARLGVVEGCLPQEVKASYDAQRSRPGGMQAVRIVTLGLSFDESSAIRLVSYYQEGARRVIRIRRYSFSGQELEARDFDVSELAFVDRYEFVGDFELFGFNTLVQEQGVRRLLLGSHDEHN